MAPEKTVMTKGIERRIKRETEQTAQRTVELAREIYLKIVDSQLWHTGAALHGQDGEDRFDYFAEAAFGGALAFEETRQKFLVMTRKVTEEDQ